MFAGIKLALSKFFENDNLFDKQHRLSVLVERLKSDLIAADVSVSVSELIANSVLSAVLDHDRGSVFDLKARVFSVMHSKLQEILGGSFESIKIHNDRTTVIMVCGPQGSGKTAFCVKLANRLKKTKKHLRVAVCSVDIKRSAAQEQLKALAKANKIDHIEVTAINRDVATSASCAAHAYAVATKSGYSVLIVDTPGSSVANVVETKRLRCVKEVVKPHEILLVLDATMGQSSTSTASRFDSLIGITGTVLTKMDSDCGGGCAINVRAVTGKPIKYITSGEQVHHIEEFRPAGIASRMLNVADSEGIMDYVRYSVGDDAHVDLAQKIANGSFDFNDLSEQLHYIKKSGSVNSVLGFLPISKSSARVEKEKTVQRQIAIISSMTKEERLDPDLITQPRRERIALGAGQSVVDVVGVIQRLTRIRKALDGDKA